MTELVECHSEYTYAEKPVALTWDGARREIIEIIARWRSPEGAHFRVRTAGNLVFELIYPEPANQWYIQPIY
jgi:hypothetical protein